jgi:hypothetical protein
LVEKLEQVEDSLVLELVFLFNFYVCFQELVPDIVLENLDTSIGQTLKLVHDHFFIVTQVSELSELLRVYLMVKYIEKVGVIQKLIITETLGNDPFILFLDLWVISISKLDIV